MRTVVHSALVALALTCAACSGDDDDKDGTKASQHPGDAGKDAGEQADAASQHPRTKPGFGMYHGGGILELDDAGRPIVRDGSVAPDTSDGGGGFGANGGSSNG